MVKLCLASLKASCYKKSPTQRNGGQFTIVMLKSTNLLPMLLSAQQ
ncbi:hypothetical protein HMPREF9554_03118 [Treponema phagedenis F0421]|nr:hypothetical protein HMPREF9554_03118 [Treponema phagedenis F0421]